MSCLWGQAPGGSERSDRRFQTAKSHTTFRSACSKAGCRWRGPGVGNVATQSRNWALAPGHQLTLVGTAGSLFVEDQVAMWMYGALHKQHQLSLSVPVTELIKLSELLDRAHRPRGRRH